MVENRTKSIFKNFLESPDSHFVYQNPDNLESADETNCEIYNARNDLLRLYDSKLEPELEASLEFVLGRESYISDQIEDALAHFQRSLALLQPTTSGILSDSEKSINPQYCVVPNTINAATILLQLGLCYRRMAEKRPAMNKSYIVEALFWFKQSLEIMESRESFDLVAKFISLVCDMLYRLENWTELHKWVQNSRKLHETYGMTGAIAVDCGFLAAVAGAEFDWLLSCELAQQALLMSEQDLEQSRAKESWYLLLLGRAQRHLGEWQEAINNLEWAKVVCELQYEPVLYLSILEELRELYFFERSQLH
ncbi:MAG: hypothetical protein HC908_18715 [Calothrix sp. SM1_7_51]|nr:hypothetical protein [Calothrix sp. SM1_7_51]